MQRSRPIATRLMVLVAMVALALVAVVPSALARGPRGPMEAASFTVTHPAVKTTLTNPGSDGHQLGDLRVTSIPVQVEGSDMTGRLDSTLTTVGIDQPNAGDEVRISVLIFSFNDGADQIVVNGTALYPKNGSTLATNTTVVRPITGGSGAFAGATGTAESEHLADGGWRHTFHLAPAMGGMGRGMHDGMGGDHHGMMGSPSASAAPAPVASTAPSVPDASAAPAAITRSLLGATDPDTAPGETLSLWSYDIPAGVTLIPHYHPGWQIARVVSGVLTYTVIEGTTDLIRADGSTEAVTNGATVTVNPGDSLIEHPDSHHYGANNGTEPVVIYAATLLTTGQPNAIPLPSASPAA